MPAPSLQSLCRKACIKNVNTFTDVGDFEYHQISDILSHLRSPEKLHQIEELSPQIKGVDAELWQKFIAKEIPKWAVKNYAPKNPLKWYEVYKRYKREQAEEIKRDEETLRETMMGIKRARDSNISKIVDLGSLPKLPRDPRMILNNGGVPISRSGLKKDASSSFNSAAGSKTKMKDGKSVLIRARREAKEIAQMGKLNRPTHQLSIGHVAKAPAAMVKEYRTASKPVFKILSRRTISKAPGIENTVLEDRERRLRALTSTSKSNGKKPNYIDVEDDSEGDELFDDSPRSPPKKQVQQSILPSKKPEISKKPSDIITAMITKPNSSSRFVTIEKATSSSQDYSLIAASTSRHLPVYNNSNPKSENTSSFISHNSDSSPVATSRLGSQQSTMPKKRKAIDIFNRGPSKRPKAG